jgi:hypothetical protein
MGMATAEPLVRQPPTPEEQAICGRMMDFNAAALPAPGEFVRAVAWLLRRRAPSLSKSAMAGLAWSLRRETQARNYRQAALSAFYLAQMFVPGLARRLHHDRRDLAGAERAKGA